MCNTFHHTATHVFTYLRGYLDDSLEVFANIIWMTHQAVCCSVLQCVAVCCKHHLNDSSRLLEDSSVMLRTSSLQTGTCSLQKKIFFRHLVCVCMYAQPYLVDSLSWCLLVSVDEHRVSATTCNTLQHTATHCNTRQQTATHCNTRQQV